MNKSLQVFYFTNPNLEKDTLNAKGVISIYKDIAIVARSERQARSLYSWKLPNEEYVLVRSVELSKHWQVPFGQYPNDNQA